MSHEPIHLELIADQLRAGSFAAAEQSAMEYCRSAQNDARGWFLLGVARHRSGKLDTALEAFDRAVQLAPMDTQAASAKAAVLDVLGKPKEATEALVRALVHSPGQILLLFNLAVMLERSGDFETALIRYDQVLLTEPEHHGALLNRGYVLSALGRFTDALANNQHLVEAYPDLAEAYYNLAETLIALERPSEALAACNRAIELEPLHAKAHIDRALALAELGRLEDAQRDLDRAHSLDAQAVHAFKAGFTKETAGYLPQFDARALYLHRLSQQQEHCNWSRRGELTRAFDELVWRAENADRELADPNLPFRTHALPIRPETRLALARGAARKLASDAASIGPSFQHVPRNSAKIRVGYVSPDFRRHPTAFLTRQLYALHDRRRFQVCCYALTPGDGSDVRKEIERGCDVFRDISGLDTAASAKRIFDDEIDILVDLAGYTNFARGAMFALRPAPIQVNFLGFPGTTGADFIDYAIVDHIVCPIGVDVLWTEKLVRMPHSYLVVNAMETVDSPGVNRATFGLPERAFVFCCFNNAFKLEPESFDIWMRLLSKTEGSVLWLFVPNEMAQTNLRGEARRRGVSCDRLIFADFWPHERHLSRYAHADLFLDTFCCNAHTTAVDALRFDVPVLTVPGDTMPSRVATSLLNAVGMPEFVCADYRAYEDSASKLANHPQELRLARNRLAKNRRTFPLFDTRGFALALEAAFEEMFRRHQSGLPPAAFDVSPAERSLWSSRWH